MRAPGRLELRADRGVGHRLVGGVEARQSARIRAALHVVLAAQRIQPGARPADVSAQQRQVGQRQGVVRAVRALADAHAPVHRRGLRAGIDARGPADVVGRHAGDLLAPTPASWPPGPPTYSSKPSVRAATNAWLASPSVTITCAIALNSALSVPGCWRSHSSANWVISVCARIDDDQPRAVSLHRLLEEGRDDRVGLGGVRADHHEAFEVAPSRRSSCSSRSSRGPVAARTRCPRGTAARSGRCCSSRSPRGGTSGAGSCPRWWPWRTRWR